MCVRTCYTGHSFTSPFGYTHLIPRKILSSSESRLSDNTHTLPRERILFYSSLHPLYARPPRRERISFIDASVRARGGDQCESVYATHGSERTLPFSRFATAAFSLLPITPGHWWIYDAVRRYVVDGRFKESPLEILPELEAENRIGVLFRWPVVLSVSSNEKDYPEGYLVQSPCFETVSYDGAFLTVRIARIVSSGHPLRLAIKEKSSERGKRTASPNETKRNENAEK